MLWQNWAVCLREWFAPFVLRHLWQTGEIGYCIRKMLCLEAFFLRQLWQTTQSPLQTWCRHSQPDLSSKMWYCIKKCYMLRLFPRSWARCGKLRSRHCSCSGDCKLGAAVTRNLFSNCFSGFTCLARCGIASEKCYIFRSFPFFCASCGTLQWRLQSRCRQPKPVFKLL